MRRTHGFVKLGAKKLMAAAGFASGLELGIGKVLGRGLPEVEEGLDGMKDVQMQTALRDLRGLVTLEDCGIGIEECSRHKRALWMKEANAHALEQRTQSVLNAERRIAAQP